MSANSPEEHVLFPVYLDVPMMVSFLAALTGGVSFEDQTMRRSAKGSDREVEAGAKLRLPGLGSLLGFDASGRMGRTDHGEDGEEVRAVRQHTAASLFNSLHRVLHGEKLLHVINGTEDVTIVAPGDVVEICGEFVGNPLEEILAFVGRVVPYMDFADNNEALKEVIEGPPISVEQTELEVAQREEEAAKLRAEAGNAKRSGDPKRKAQASDLELQAQEKAAEAERVKQLLPLAVKVVEAQEQRKILRLLVQMRDELAESAVHDTVIIGPDGLKAILTMSSEFYGEATNAYLREGVFTVIGKVTRVLDRGDQINLLRRTVLGAAGADQGRAMLQSAINSKELDLATFDPIIQPPALQVLPLAVYV
jgi:hypothetical protein